MNKSTNINNLNNFKSENFDWKLVQSEMKNKLGLDIYESWLKKITFVDEFNNYLLLSVPTRFIRDWITSRYLDQILQIVRNYKKNIIRIEFKIDDKETTGSNEKITNTQNFENTEYLVDYFDNFSADLKKNNLNSYLKSVNNL